MLSTSLHRSMWIALIGCALLLATASVAQQLEVEQSGTASTATSSAGTLVLEGRIGWPVVARSSGGSFEVTGGVFPLAEPLLGDPIFVDGFESGSVSAWSSAVGVLP